MQLAVADCRRARRRAGRRRGERPRPRAASSASSTSNCPRSAPAWQRRIAGGTRLAAGAAARSGPSSWTPRSSAATAPAIRCPVRRAGHVGPLKVIIDGSLNTRTAYCFDPYPGATGPDRHGLLTVRPGPARRSTARARDAAGLTAAVHAIGDHANAARPRRVRAVPFADPAAAASNTPSCSRPDDIARMARLGLIASVQPEHAVDDRDVADGTGPGAPRAPSPTVRCSTPACRSRSARTRRWRRSIRGSRSPRPRSERATGANRGIPSSASRSARPSRASVHSRIEAGQVADLVVVDQDPLAEHGRPAARRCRSPPRCSPAGGRSTRWVSRTRIMPSCVVGRDLSPVGCEDPADRQAPPTRHRRRH